MPASKKPQSATAAKAAPSKQTAQKAKVVKEEALPLCMCGCGERVAKKTSQFKPGHDARLRGRLLKLRRADAARGNNDSKKTEAEREADYNEALAALKGVELDAAYKWLGAAHNQ